MPTLLAAISLPSMRLLLLGGSAAILYIVGRLVMSAIPRQIDGSTLRAMLGTITVLVLGVTAVLMERPEVAMHLPIAAAAGALTFGVAAVIMGRGAIGATSAVASRSWMLVVPAVALVVIGGFGGRVDWLMLGLLLAYGAAALSAWLPDRQPASRVTATGLVQVASGTGVAGPVVAPGTFGETVVASVPAESAKAAGEPSAPSRTGASYAFAFIVWLGSVGLAALAGVMAMNGLPALESMRHVSADALVTVFLLAPAIVVPVVFELLPPCRPIGWTASVSTVTKFAVMCLCIALPLIVLVAADVHVIRALRATMGAMPTATSVMTPTSGPAATTTAAANVSEAIASTQPVDAAPRLAFASLPHVALSTDLVILAAASLMLLPVAGGWLRPGRLEAAALFVCYALNLLLVVGAMMA